MLMLCLDTAERVSMATRFSQHTCPGLGQRDFAAQETQAESFHSDEFHRSLLTTYYVPAANHRIGCGTEIKNKELTA